MFAWGSKYFFAVSVAALLGAMIYGIASGGDIVGVISSGYKGGVGDHFGYSLLLGAGLVCACLGTLSVLVRDADIDPNEPAQTAVTIAPPRDSSIWGVVAAFGIACLALGLAISVTFLYLGLAILFVAGLEWTVLAWADRATGDPEINRTVRNRVLGPIEVPMLSALAIAVGVVGASRILLAVSHTAATVLASVLAASIFFGAVAMAKSNASRSIIAGFVTVMAVAILGGGIAGAVVGEYDHHGDESHGEEGHGEQSHGDEDHSEDSSDKEGEESAEADDSASEEE